MNDSTGQKETRSQKDAPGAPVADPQENGCSQEAVDPARMQDLVESLDDSLADVIDIYLEDTPLLIASMRSACSAGDWSALQGAAHTLKSSSGIFGALEMVRLCRQLESEAGVVTEERAPAHLDGLVEALDAAFQKVTVVLNLYLRPS